MFADPVSRGNTLNPQVYRSESLPSASAVAVAALGPEAHVASDYPAVRPMRSFTLGCVKQ
uniref:Uncharacterized protein n=1 Tax=Peronospora matthiolae TaxID=2874970 RepID=A0AAV1T755_9STRA